MIKVSILGNGNVAVQLAKAILKAKKCNLVEIYTRSKPNAYFKKKGIATTQKIAALKKADIYIIAIADDAIASFSKKIDVKNKLVVHTSGSVAMQDLQCMTNKGVFYPLQSISKSKKINFKKIPICIETEREEDSILLQKLAVAISNSVYKINSVQRKKLHVAAVFVNNFVNHLYQIAYELCQENEVDFNILKPLIKETALKIQTLTPKEAQTGPAKRNDALTIKKQVALLNKHQQTIYNILTNDIKRTNK